MNMIMPATAVSQPQTSPQATNGEPLGQTTAPSGAIPPEAVKPAQQTDSETKVRNATSFAGKGAGAGEQDVPGSGQTPTGAREGRPADATPSSIMNAKVAEAPEAQTQPAAKPVANHALASVQDMDPENADVLPRPPLKLPDPLPTSPFLKPSGG